VQCVHPLTLRLKINTNQGSDMKRTSFSNLSKLGLVAGAACILCLALPLQAATWSVQEIGPAHEAGRLYLNNAGHVAGTYEQANGHLAAFVTGSNGQGRHDFVPLTGGDETSALGINASGQVLVVSGTTTTPSGTQHAYALGNVNGGTLVKVHDADDINDQHAWLASNGTVGGMDPNKGFGPGRGFFGSTALPSSVLEVLSMNESGQFLVRTAKGVFISDSSGKTGKKVPPVLPIDLRLLDVISFDAQGRVYGAGRGRTSTESHMFVWEPAPQKRPLQYHPASMALSSSDIVSAVGANANGQLIGRVEVDGESRALISGPGMNGLRDLTGDVTLPDGGSLTHAWAINANGQVAAFDAINQKAYLLTPGPSSSCTVEYVVTDEQDKTFSVDMTMTNTGGGDARGVFAQVDYGFSTKISDVIDGIAQVKSKVVYLSPTASDLVVSGDSVTVSFTGTKKIGALAAPTGISATLGGETCRILP
jgi:hypothetical protein